MQSALSLQVNWPNVVKDLTERLMRTGSAEQQKQAARVLLEFMKVRSDSHVGLTRCPFCIINSSRSRLLGRCVFQPCCPSWSKSQARLIYSSWLLGQRFRYFARGYVTTRENATPLLKKLGVANKPEGSDCCTNHEKYSFFSCFVYVVFLWTPSPCPRLVGFRKYGGDVEYTGVYAYCRIPLDFARFFVVYPECTCFWLQSHRIYQTPARFFLLYPECTCFWLQSHRVYQVPVFGRRPLAFAPFL